MAGSSHALESPPSAATPILDRLVPVPQPRNHGRLANLWRVLFWALIGAAIGITLLLADKKFFDTLMEPLSRALSRLAPLGFLLAFLVCQYVVVIVHEMGHLIFGLCAGLRFNFVSFGPLLINRDFKASLHWKQRSGAGGLTSMVPNGNHRLRWRLLFMIVGGPMANLTSAAIAAMAYKSHLGNFSAVSGVFLWLSVFTGLFNLVPFRSISILSDGKRIWLLLLNKKKGERWLSNTLLATALIKGDRPRDFDKEMLKSAVSFTDNSPDTVSAHVLAYMAAFDAHQDDQAARFLETCLAYCRFAAPSGREGLFISAAIFQALRRSRVDLAEQWLAAVPAKTQIPGIRSQAEAAILEAQGKIEDALAKLDESKAASATIAQPSMRTLSLASIERWKNELSAAGSPSASGNKANPTF